MQGVKVTVSGAEVANRDIICLILILLLLLYSCYNCYVQWRNNYQVPDGEFYFYKGKTLFQLPTKSKPKENICGNCLQRKQMIIIKNIQGQM